MAEERDAANPDGQARHARSDRERLRQGRRSAPVSFPGAIVKDAKTLKHGEEIEVRFAKGTAEAKVVDTK